MLLCTYMYVQTSILTRAWCSVFFGTAVPEWNERQVRACQSMSEQLMVNSDKTNSKRSRFKRGTDQRCLGLEASRSGTAGHTTGWAFKRFRRSWEYFDISWPFRKPPFFVSTTAKSRAFQCFLGSTRMPASNLPVAVATAPRSDEEAWEPRSPVMAPERIWAATDTRDSMGRGQNKCHRFGFGRPALSALSLPTGTADTKLANCSESRPGNGGFENMSNIWSETRVWMDLSTPWR